jgi:hypothetical protein
MSSPPAAKSAVMARSDPARGCTAREGGRRLIGADCATWMCMGAGCDKSESCTTESQQKKKCGVHLCLVDTHPKLVRVETVGLGLVT